MLVVQPAQRQVTGTAPPVHAADQVQRSGWLLAPTRRHAQQRLAPDVVAEVLDDRKGVRVGPMQILEHHDQRAGPSQSPQQTQDSLATYRRRRITMAPAAEGRHNCPERREPRRKVPVVGEITITQRLEQRFGQRPIRGAGAAGDRPARYHRHVPRPGRRWPPREQAGTCLCPPRQSGTPCCPCHQRQCSAPPAARQAPPLARQLPGTAHRPYRECVPSRAPATGRPARATTLTVDAIALDARADLGWACAYRPPTALRNASADEWAVGSASGFNAGTDRSARRSAASSPVRIASARRFVPAGEPLQVRDRPQAWLT